MEKILNYINGELIEPSSKIYIENIDPSCGKAYSLVPDSCADDVNEAVKSAKVAYSFWSKTTKQERSDANYVDNPTDDPEGLFQN